MTYTNVEVFNAIGNVFKPAFYPEYSSMEIDELAGKVLEFLRDNQDLTGFSE